MELEKFVEKVSGLVKNRRSDLEAIEQTEQVIILISFDDRPILELAKYFSGSKATQERRVIFPIPRHGNRTSFVLLDYLRLEDRENNFIEGVANRFLIKRVLEKSKQFKIVIYDYIHISSMIVVQYLLDDRQMAFQKSIGLIYLACVPEIQHKIDGILEDLTTCMTSTNFKESEIKIENLIYNKMDYAELSPKELQVQVTNKTAFAIKRLYDDFYNNVDHFAKFTYNYIAPEEDYRDQLNMTILNKIYLQFWNITEHFWFNGTYLPMNLLACLRENKVSANGMLDEFDGITKQQDAYYQLNVFMGKIDSRDNLRDSLTSITVAVKKTLKHLSLVYDNYDLREKLSDINLMFSDDKKSNRIFQWNKNAKINDIRVQLIKSALKDYQEEVSKAFKRATDHYLTENGFSNLGVYGIKKLVDDISFSNDIQHVGLQNADFITAWLASDSKILPENWLATLMDITSIFNETKLPTTASRFFGANKRHNMEKVEDILEKLGDGLIAEMVEYFFENRYETESKRHDEITSISNIVLFLRIGIRDSRNLTKFMEYLTHIKKFLYRNAWFLDNNGHFFEDLKNYEKQIGNNTGNWGAGFQRFLTYFDLFKNVQNNSTKNEQTRGIWEAELKQTYNEFKITFVSIISDKLIQLTIKDIDLLVSQLSDTIINEFRNRMVESNQLSEIEVFLSIAPKKRRQDLQYSQMSFHRFVEEVKMFFGNNYIELEHDQQKLLAAIEANFDYVSQRLLNQTDQKMDTTHHWGKNFFSAERFGRSSSVKTTSVLNQACKTGYEVGQTVWRFIESESAEIGNSFLLLLNVALRKITNRNQRKVKRLRAPISSLSAQACALNIVEDCERELDKLIGANDCRFNSLNLQRNLIRQIMQLDDISNVELIRQDALKIVNAEVDREINFKKI